MTQFIVVYDACVLFPAPLCDLLKIRRLVLNVILATYADNN